MSKWTKFSDKLPELTKDCNELWVYGETCGVIKRSYIQVTSESAKEVFKKLALSNGYTHWMPREAPPEPPEE